MDCFRSSLACIERSARLSAAGSRNARGANANGSQMLRRIAAIAIAVLALTNVLTWRAFVSERAARQEARQQGRREATLTLSAWPAKVDLWNAVRPQRTVGSVDTLTATLPTGNAMNSAALNARLSEQMADPKTHDALRDQEKGNALQLYGELLERWHLSGRSAAFILDALADHELNNFTTAVAEDSNGADVNAADEATVQALLTQKQLEELRAFDASLADRSTIAPFVRELSLVGAPLPPDRVERLVDIMHQERVAVPPPEAPLPSQSTATYSQAIDEWQLALDQRIRDRAALILSPDLVSRLEIFQNSQRTANSVFASLGPESGQPVQPGVDHPAVAECEAH